MDEEPESDSDWIRMQRQEWDRRKWLWRLVKTSATWIAGGIAGAWASVDAFTKLTEWLTKK